jgi:clan AA aspartic protease
MGITYAEIELTNEDDLTLVRRGYLPSDRVRRVKVRAMVDSGSSLLSLPGSVQQQLGLEVLGEGDVELADGSVMVDLEVVGPVEVRFQNRRTLVEAIVVPNATEVLLGAIPMQGMDVLIDPKHERLIVNPQSPDRARLLLK